MDKRQIDVYDFGPDTEFMYVTLGIRVRPEKLPHNVPNCGYHIFNWTLDEKLFFATDCSSLDGIEAKNYGLYMIESNHKKAEIEARIAAKQAAGEFAYEEEAARNHLSEEQAMDWLAANMGPESRYVLLHQHQEKEKKIEDNCGNPG